MKYEALQSFTGVVGSTINDKGEAVGGVETKFAKGEIIPEAVAKELGLDAKPHLAIDAALAQKARDDAAKAVGK